MFLVKKQAISIFCVLAVLAISACAFTPKELELTAQPQVPESTVGSDTVLFFRFIDDRDELTVGHRAASTMGAKITAERLPEYVETKLRDGLLRKKYLLTDDEGTAEASVIYRLRAFKFYLETGFFTGAENKEAAISVDARRAARSYSEVYRFADEDRDIFIPGGQEIDDEMNEALAHVLTAALTDTELDRFLTGMDGTSSAAPVATGSDTQATAPSTIPIREQGRLSEAELRSVLPGAVLRGTSAQGNGFIVTYHGNGALSGQGESSSDVGKWAIEGDTVCTTWTKWRNGERRCFYFVKDGDWYTAYFTGTNELNAKVMLSRS